MLKDIDFSNVESKRIRTIGYKKDGNTPCKHFYDAYPLNKVFNNEAYKSLYIALIRKSYQDGGNDYNGGYYMIFNDIGNNVHVEFLGVSGHDDIDLIKGKINTMQARIGRNGFLSYLINETAKGRIARNSDIMALDMIGETELAEKYRQEKIVVIEKRKQEEKERREQYIKEQEEKEKRIEEEKRIALETAEKKIKNRQTVENDDGIILELMRKYNINVPLRTQGWILKCLISVSFNEYGVSCNYRKYNKNKCSQKVFDCLEELINIIDSQ